jgi:hypothetical protein
MRQLGSAPRSPTILVALASSVWLVLGGVASAGAGEPDLSAQGVAPPEAATEPAPTDLRTALTSGDWWIRLRLRYEDVDEDAFSSDAHALTLRTVLGYETGAWHGFSALLEFEDVTPIPEDDAYNSTTNGETDRPVIADPDGTEVNQVFLRYVLEDVGSARVGRQKITLDNLRWIGDSAWRQNEQTYDAASAEFGLPGKVRGFYAYLDNVNRVNGEDSAVGDARTGSHLVHLERPFEGWGKLSLYDYYLDFDSSAFVGFSSNTLGARFAGLHPLDEDFELNYALEFANQTDVGDNPGDLDEDYYLAEFGGRAGLFSGGIGYEVLGGDGAAAVQTPLASFHPFNGYADKFTVTPDDGLRDLYVHAGAKVGKGSLRAFWHDFQADSGSDEYGDELDLVFTWPLAKDVTGGLKYADYSADDFATDTRKAWIWVEASL